MSSNLFVLFEPSEASRGAADVRLMKSSTEIHRSFKNDLAGGGFSLIISADSLIKRVSHTAPVCADHGADLASF